MASSKPYWLILKTLLNNKKIPLLQDNKHVIDLKKKAELFNCFLAKQCSTIGNSSKLPLSFCKKKEKDQSISAITFACDDIVTLSENLDPNKAHGHEKKANVIPVHKTTKQEISRF